MTTTKLTNGNGVAPAWHAGFLPMLPAIRRCASALFRHLSREERDEAVADVTAVAMMDYLGGIGGSTAACADPAALATSAALHVRHGDRAFGRESNCDVLSPTAQHQRGFEVEHLKSSCDAQRLRIRIDLRKHGQKYERTQPHEAVMETNRQNRSPLSQERNRRRKAEERLDATDIEFEAARRIQERLLPAAAPALPRFDIAGMTCPAQATGGDYFDYVPMRDKCVGIVVGDVSGHGFGPALLMASTRAYLRAFAQTQSDLGELLSHVNRVLTLDMEDERFVTLFLARLDPRKRSLVYASAGHPTGYVLDAMGHVRLRLPSTGPLLGSASDGSYLASPEIPITTNEVVILLSDGVIEASAPDGMAFGWKRAVSICRLYRQDPAARIVSNLYHAVRAFAQNEPQVDDMTAVIIKANGSSAGRQP